MTISQSRLCPVLVQFRVVVQLLIWSLLCFKIGLSQGLPNLAEPSSLGYGSFEELLQRAKESYEKGNYKDGIPRYEKVLELTESTLGKEHPLVARTLLTLGTMHVGIGEPGKALPLLDRALSIIERHTEDRDYREGLVAVLMQTGVAWRDLERFADSTAAFERCLKIQQETFGRESTNCCASLKALGDLFSTQGDYSRALMFYRQCLRIEQNTFGPEYPAVAVLWNNMAHIYESQCDFARALPLYQGALGVYSKAYGSNHLGVATILNNIAVVLAALGRADEARIACQRGLSIRQSALRTENPDVVTSLMTLALIEESCGNNDDSLHQYQRCLEIEDSLSGKDDVQLATLLSALSFRYRAQGDYGKAMSCAQRSVSINEKLFGAGHPNTATALEDLAHVYWAEGKRGEARPLLIRGLEISAKGYGIDHPSVANTTRDLALLDAEEYELTRSLDGFRVFFLLQRRYLCSQVPALSEAEGMHLLQARFYNEGIFHSLCGLAVSNGIATGKILGAEQLAISKALLEEVRVAQSALESDPATATQELITRWRATKAQLMRVSESILDTERRDRERQKLENQLGQLGEEMAKRVDFVQRTTKEWNLTLTNIARGLPKEAALVDFVQYRAYDFAAKTNKWGGFHFAAYLTFPEAEDSTNLVVERVDLGDAGPIDKCIGVILKRMSAPYPQYRSDDLKAALAQVSESVYAPLAKYLANISHLIICSEGQLSLLPFEMLSFRGHYLIEDKRISYVGSGREIVHLAKQKGKNLDYAPPLLIGNPDFELNLAVTNPSAHEIIGAPELSNNSLEPTEMRSLGRSYRGMTFSPLPQSEEEVRSVARILGTNSLLRLGRQAREREVKAIQSPQILHFATHGLFLPDQEVRRMELLSNGVFGENARGLIPGDWENPLMRCALALAGANHAFERTNLVEDGLLTAQEAALLNLQHTALVILSACDTGTGEVKIGEGVMSMRRAFRIAGAETVLASHWPVSDKATAVLMEDFIRRWRSGKARVEAWRDAQLSLLNSKDFSSPYFWAAFTLMGQWR